MSSWRRSTGLTRLALALALWAALGGCGGNDGDKRSAADLGPATDLGTLADAGPADGGAPDAGEADAGPADAGRPDAGTPDAGAADAGEPDAGAPGWAYRPHAPLAAALPETLRGARWIQHLRDDLLPYWTMPAALGTPAGNFPTFRGMDGSLQGSGERRPRMISRQIFFYCTAFQLTGDVQQLAHARAGVDWLLAHAKDRARGGWHTVLDATGQPGADEPKTAQDLAYDLLGLAAWFFVTHDPAVETELLTARDLLFDPAVYWDAEHQRIRDAVSPDLTGEVDLKGDGGWELVAQLDPINAFLLLTQPVLSDPARRQQFLGDLERLGHTLVDRFWSAGMFWGIHNRPGAYGTDHVDFGHTLKAHAMLLAIDRRLPAHPFHEFLVANLPPALARALDPGAGRWGKRPTGASGVEWGSDWWAYAEADQLAATLLLLGVGEPTQLAATAGHWLTDYVDRTRPAREVVPSIDRNGGWVWPWPDSDTAKCNQWKSGYHTSEHALMLYLAGQGLAGAPAVLHFAVPPAQVATFTARPYFFEGRELRRTPGEEVTVGGTALRVVQVEFADVY